MVWEHRDVFVDWICRLILKSSAEVLEIRYLVQGHWPWICRLVLIFRLKLSAGYQDPLSKVSYVLPYIWNSDIWRDAIICYCILIILIFFYVVCLRTRFDETLGRIFYPKNLGQRLEDKLTNPDLNPRSDIMILDREFHICGRISETQI